MSEKKSAKESANPEKVDGGADSIEKVERIRDIVFGAQMRDYDRRFGGIARDISRIQQEMNSANEKILGQIKALDNQLREHHERLSARVQEQGKQLSARIEQVDSQQSAKMSELDTRFGTQMRQLEEDLTRQLQSLRMAGDEQFDGLHRSVAQISEDLRDEIRDHADRLSDSKTDRTTLGQLLIQVGKDLQEGTGASVFSQLLDELASETVAD